jgi:hypothetical protein
MIEGLPSSCSIQPGNCLPFIWGHSCWHIGSHFMTPGTKQSMVDLRWSIMVFLGLFLVIQSK